MMSLVMVTMTSAQTVHEGKMFDNVYTTVSVSTVNPTTVWNGVKNIRPGFGIEVGKQITTLYTTGLEFTAGVNTTGVKTAFDDMALLWLHKLNVTNMIWGYCPDARWDLNVVGGLGWGHDMVVRDNYGVVQAGLEVAYNLNDTWSILAKPNIEWHHVNDGLNVNKSNVGLSIGVSYKFPNGDGGRGFTLCSEDQFFLESQRLNGEINDLRQQLEGQKVINNNLNAKLKLHEQHQCQVDTVIIDNTIAPTLGFVINKAELTEQSNDNEYQEKHVPIVTIEGETKTIRVGSIPHPMENDHYIMFIEAISPDKKYLKRKYLMPTEEPKMDLKQCCHYDEFTARELCNIHGLWVSENK